MLYINLMVITNQKSIIDIHTKKKKESKHNYKDSHQITREENKRRKKEKKTYKKQPPGTSQVVQWLRIHLPMQGTWV